MSVSYSSRESKQRWINNTFKNSLLSLSTGASPVMASHKLSTGSTGENDVFETLTPAETSESSDPNERPRIEANGVSIDKEMLAVEEKDTTQKVNGVKEQSEGSDFFDDQGQNDREHALKQASEVASNIKDLRDRVTLLEESLAKGHGTKETKSDVNKDDATYDLLIQGSQLHQNAKLY